MIGSGDRFRQVHVGALALAAVMLPWSEFLLSNAQFLLIGNWLVEGIVRKDLVGRFKRAFTSGPCLVFISFFALHVLGLLWTEDLGWGLDLCRILLPVIAFAPVLASSSRLSAKEFRTILLLGAWSTVASTMVCLTLRYDVIGRGGYRELSIFISHIRLALLLCFSIAVFVLQWPGQLWKRVSHALGIGWCIFFLDRMSSLLGFAILGLIGTYIIWQWSSSQQKITRLITRAFLMALPIACVGYARWCAFNYHASETMDLSRLETTSAGGERYFNDTLNLQHENGHHVWIQIADGELERAWNRRSRLDYHHLEQADQPFRSTLVRYMSSMGLRKDSIGALALTDADIQRIELGVSSVLTGRRDPIRARIDQVLYEVERFRETGNASGYSVAMRYEFLRAGWAIAQEHPFTGVGTGDTRPAFAAQYEHMSSPLEERWRLRAHNQYLTLLISFGMFGLLWSLFAWLWPAWRLGATKTPLFVCWAIVFGVSCLSEDTVETQMGATFFAFYYALLVFSAPVTRSADPPIDAR